MFLQTLLLGLSGKFLNLVQVFYEDTKSFVWCKNRVTDLFYTSCGVRQGCLLSPLSFPLFVNDLQEEVGEGI